MAKWFCLHCIGEHETQIEIDLCKTNFLKTFTITPERIAEIWKIIKDMPPIGEEI